jgi:hypothetical protein
MHAPPLSISAFQDFSFPAFSPEGDNRHFRFLFSVSAFPKEHPHRLPVPSQELLLIVCQQQSCRYL